MKSLTREWVLKADGNYLTAVREQRVVDRPNYDAVCFHAQQCVEKYLKARLQESSVMFGRTHNLVALLELALEVEPAWESLRSDLLTLNAYAVVVRYPGESADARVGAEALAVCEKVRTAARAGLRVDEAHLDVS
jgi:HEPN domain-containing protein